MKQREIINLTDKPLTEFVAGDTLYASKAATPGHPATLLCEFVKMDRGLVTVIVKSVEPDWARHYIPIGETIRVRVAKCYLWGKREGEKWERCNWFDPKTKKVKE